MGVEAQLDWKESMNYTLKTGEVINLNIFALVYSYSRYSVNFISLTKKQGALFHYLDQAFESAGGIPDILKTDNMKTVMDEARTEYSSGKVNVKFQQFADDYGFMVKPCIAGNVKLQTLPTLQLQIKIIRFLYFLNCNRKLF